jgi:hypothetical protein
VIVVGIDPGTVTGFAVWDAAERKLWRVESMMLHQAMTAVLDIRAQKGTRGMPLEPGQLLVIFEDARTLRISGGRMENEQKKYGAAVREGVGSIKRDCAIWEEFLEDHGIAYQCKKWTRGTTKWDADYFKRTTGWVGTTNNHARDAAVIVFGLNLPMCGGIVRVWQEEQQRKKRSIGKSSAAPSMRARRTSRSFPIAGAG